MRIKYTVENSVIYENITDYIIYERNDMWKIDAFPMEFESRQDAEKLVEDIYTSETAGKSIYDLDVAIKRLNLKNIL